MRTETEERVRRSAAELLEDGFLENRARLLEVAAFLDRLDRAPGAAGVREDFRFRALDGMLKAIATGGRNRAEEILLLLSDPGTEPAADAIPPGKAAGAWKGAR